MKVLVTGGAGFIGSNFVRRTLITRPNIEITVLDALTYAGSMNNLQGYLSQIQFVHGNINDRELVESLVPQFDVVVHFAAESHNDNSLVSPQLFFETNVMGTLVLASACLISKVRLHHVSTDEVFGDLPLDSDEEFDIDTPYNPSSPYSASKAASDHLIRAWTKSFDLQATISNCSNNYGPRQNWEKLIPATIRRIFLGKKPLLYGAGENIRDWIHVDDHTDGIWAILDRGRIGETYLLGAGDRVSNIDLVRQVLLHMGKPLDFLDYVADRPSHDRRYAVNPRSSLALGWSPRHLSIKVELKELIDSYLDQLRTENQ